MPGYLSLHQTVTSLTIKWTPNQLMNGYNETEVTDKTSYWKYSLNINVDEIVYVHCHQLSGEENGGTIILVGQDGVQRPPIHFPEGGHMAQFLSCLETGIEVVDRTSIHVDLNFFCSNNINFVQGCCHMANWIHRYGHKKVWAKRFHGFRRAIGDLCRRSWKTQKTCQSIMCFVLSTKQTTRNFANSCRNFQSITFEIN